MNGVRVWVPVAGRSPDDSLAELVEQFVEFLAEHEIQAVKRPERGRGGSPVEIEVVFATRADADMAFCFWRLRGRDMNNSCS